MSHPREDLDDLLQHSVRLSIMGALSGAQEVEFGFLRDALAVSDSVLSRQLSQLEEALYVNIRKGYVGKRPRTWLSLTEHGKTIFTRHVEALQKIIHVQNPEEQRQGR